MPKCKKCNNTGVIETGNNDLPCDCPAGENALFNQAGVIGPVTGKELRRHFFNNSPEPIVVGRTPIQAASLPGRTEYVRDIVQRHYDYLFEKMLRHEGKLKKGVMLLSRRPRVDCRTKADAEKVLDEIENFLRKNLPRVKIPPRPEILR